MRVYIAGPYTKGDVAVNVRNAIITGDEVFNLGHSPYIPHLTHFWHMLCPRDWGAWVSQDSVWLLQCEAVIRLPGESKGADIEIALAKSKGIPVYEGLEDFIYRSTRSA